MLIRAVDDPDRDRLIAALPAELHDDYAVRVPYHPRELPAYLDEVARIAHATPEEARYRAQLALSLIAAWDPDLMAAIDVPPELRELTEPLPGTGLTEDELRAALDRLPLWDGDPGALTRTIVLPPENLDRVLTRLERLRQEFGRGPKISRPERDTAVLAVTPPDIDLAHRVDAAIEEAGAGMA